MQEKIKRLLKQNNGIITTKQIEEIGISRVHIKQFIEEGIIEKVKRGIYYSTDIFDDEFYIFQMKNQNAIFSYNTAMYFHGETERTPHEIKLKNNRMKDYYDLYFFVNYKWNDRDKEILVDAVIRTFAARNSIMELKNMNETIKSLQENEFLNKLWLDCRKKHDYSKDINFEDTIKAIEVIKEEIFANDKIKKQILSI